MRPLLYTLLFTPESINNELEWSNKYENVVLHKVSSINNPEFLRAFTYSKCSC